MHNKHLLLVLSTVALTVTSTAATSAISVQAQGIRPKPYLVMPSQTGLLTGGTANLASPYLAGVGGTPAYSGVGTLLIEGTGGGFVCTGSLLSPTIVLTAAHCVGSPEMGTVQSLSFALPNGRPFYGVSPAPNPGTPAIYTGAGYATAPNWNYDTLAGDVAVIKLQDPVTSGADYYDIYRDNPLGKQFTQVGTGTAGWGAVGADSDTGFAGGYFDLRKRAGENIFEGYGVEFWNAFNEQFGGPVLGELGGPLDGILLFDFDSGLAQNDVFCHLSAFSNPALSSLSVCQTGLSDETNTAPGDSGGPAFIDGKIAAITSFGITGAILTFDPTTGLITCGGPGDIDVSYDPDLQDCTDSSFGEISGDTNIASYAWFVDAAMAGNVRFVSVVPEPASLALIGGGLAGLAALRRRRKERPE